MATRITPSKNDRYYINPATITFVEDSGYGVQLIQVSASSSCYILVYDPENGIRANEEGGIRRWKVTAYNNKFPDGDTTPWNIYIRLERSGTSGLVVYDKRNRAVSGGVITEIGGETVTGDADPNYYYIKIGEVGETDGYSIVRKITYDTGYLDTYEANQAVGELLSRMFVPHYDDPDDPRKLSWIEAKSNMGIQGGVTMFVRGEGMDLPGIYDGIPLDGDTIYWEEVKDSDGSVIGKVLKSKGGSFEGTLGALSNVGEWADTLPESDRIMVQKKGSRQWESLPMESIGSVSFGNITESGDGNAYTSITLSEDKKYLTLNKGKSFATSEDLDKRVNDLVNGAPAAYDTLKEISDVLQGNVNSIGDIISTLGRKADKAATLGGYGITDAKIANGVITLGANTITPLTSHQSIYTLTFQSGTFSSGSFTANSGNKTINIPTTTSHVSEGANLYFTNARAVGALADTLKDYVTLSGTQTITGEKDFTGSLKVNGSQIVYDKTNKYWKLEGDLLVTGGITMYGVDGSSFGTIWDNAPLATTNEGYKGVASFDPNYFSVNNGHVTFIGDVGGGIESITKQMVIDALGYTPYDASNPNNYVTSSGTVANATNLTSYNAVTFTKSDNGGKPCYLLIADVTSWYSASASVYEWGIAGIMYGWRGGNLSGTCVQKMIAMCSYNKNNYELKSDVITYVKPRIVSYGEKYYIALYMAGSGRSHYFIGKTSRLLDTFIEVECDSNGNCDGLTIVFDTETMSMSGASVGKLTTKRKIWGQDFDGSADVSGAITGATTGSFSGNVSMGSATINGGNLTYNSSDKYWKIEGNLVVTGGITMFANDGTYTHSTITDAVNIDNQTIILQDGKLMVNPELSLGGEASSIAWNNIVGVPTWITVSKPKYSYTEITGTPDLSVYATKGATLSHYGITDAKISDGVITIGSDTIVPLTKKNGDERYVSGLGTSGNNLTWEINGKINNIIVPYSRKANELNDFNVVTFSKNDNSGYPCHLLIADVTDWYNSLSNAATKGLMGFVYAYRDGFNPSYTLSLSAICSWGSGARELTSDMITVIEPCVVSYDGSYYLSLLLKGSNKTYKFIGRTQNLLSSFIELKCSSDGTFSGLEVIHSGSAKGTSNTAVKLANKVKLWGNDFDGSESVNGNISNTGNIIPVGNGNESVGSKDKSFESVYADGYRWTENDSATIKSKGWYRFAESLVVDTIGNTCLLSIRRVYANSEDESYMIAVTAGYNGAVSFTQISGRSRVNAITKIRATSDASGVVYFDFYYDSTKSNKVIVNGVGSVKTYVPTETLDKRTNVTEFELRKGFKAYQISGFSYQRNKSGKNLLTDGDLRIGDEAYLIGKYQYDPSVTNGRTYRVTLCAKLGEENEYITAFWDGGNANNTRITGLSNTEERIVSFTAKITNKKTLSFYQYPNGKFGSYVRWAYLEEAFKEDELSEDDYKVWSESHDKLDSKSFVHNLQRLDFSGGSYWSSDEGLNVNGGKLSYNATDKYWKLDGNLFVTGGITMFGNDSITAPTIMDAIHVDGKTISKANGYLEVIGGVGGGLNEEELNDYLNFKGYITSTVGDERYLKRSLSGYTALTNSETGVLNFNSTSGVESGLRLLLNGSNGGGLWYHPSYGIYLYHANTGSRLGINESGNPYIGNNTLLHSGNYANYTPMLNSSTTHATKDSVIYAPTTAGTSNYVLKSNGSGAPSWVAQSNLSVGSADNSSKLGGYGLTRFVQLRGVYDASGTDLNGLDKAGYYKVSQPSNLPSGIYKYGMLETIEVHSSTENDTEKRTAQVYYPHIASSDYNYYGMAVRVRNGAPNVIDNAWGEWRYFVTKDGNVASATTASKLSAVNKTAWGQTYWTSGGIPTNISGDMSNVGNITPSLHNTYSIGSYGNSFNWLNVNCISSGKISNGLWLCGGTNAGTGVVIARSGSNSATGEICRFTDVGMIWASGVLCTIATTGRELELKYNNADATSIVLNSGSFKPFVSASNNLMLGRYDSLWKGVYLGIDSTSANNVKGVNFCDGSGYGIGHVSSSTTNLGIYSVGSVYLRGGCTKAANGVMTVSNTGAIIDSSGNMLVTGGVTMYSDIRKKTKLRDVELAIRQIADAPLIEHYYNSDENKTTHVGSIAQYWYGMNDWFCKEDNEGFLTMEIQNAALASAICVARELLKFESETDRRIRLLEEENVSLRREIERLRFT